MLKIDPIDLVIIQQILKQYVPTYPVWAFGSRVTGTPKKYSDLDLVIISKQPLSISTIGDVREAFSESNLAFRVDVCDWASLDESFQKIISQGFEVIKE